MVAARGFEWRTLRAVALVLLAVKLMLLVVARPFMDETYYFMWGQHPQLSYFDHPSLTGWTQAIAGAVLGWNVAGLRVMVLASLVGDLILLRLLARRLYGEAWRDGFWTAVVLFLATPILFGLSSVALPDHLLMLFALAAVYAMLRLEDEPTAGRWLYAAALAIGLATLSKYTGAFLGAAALLHFALARRLHPVWRNPHFYAAGLLMVAMQVPVLVWNVQHGLASFAFITGGRAGLGGGFTLGGLSGFLLGALAVLSPAWLVPLARLLMAGHDGLGYGRTVFWMSTLAFLAASLFTNILIHWNAVAYVAVLPALAMHFRSRWLMGLQIVYGTLAIGLAAVNYSILPVTAALSGNSDQTSAWSYGWEEVAAAVREVKAQSGAGIVAGTDYTLASPLAFALADAAVTSLTPKRDAYDDWFDPAAHRGQDAVIVADPWRPLSGEVAAQFRSVEPVRTLDLTRYGRHLDTVTIYLAHGFAP